MKSIKRINSHVGISRFLASCREVANKDVKVYGHVRAADCPRQPYRHSEFIPVFMWDDIYVIVLETGQRRYEVFQVEESEIIKGVEEVED